MDFWTKRDGTPVIVTDASRLEVKKNAHPECSGRDWGWIEGTNNACWSNDDSIRGRSWAEAIVKWEKERSRLTAAQASVAEIEGLLRSIEDCLPVQSAVEKAMRGEEVQG